jgi:hypothetical protein
MMPFREESVTFRVKEYPTMGAKIEYQTSSDEIYVAGQRVLPGRYRQIDCEREILLEDEDVLPASFDGRVAVYQRVNQTWGEIAAHAVVGR